VVVSSLVAGLVLLGPGLAQTEKGKKYALLVGVREYHHDSLRDLAHTENDVEELSEVLTASGYKVAVMTCTRGKKRAFAQPTAKNIRDMLGRILKRVTKHDTVLVALSGHGIQARVKAGGSEKEESFFCPTDAKPRDTTDPKVLGETMIGIAEVFKELEESGAGVKLLLVDACRNDPKLGRNVDVDSVPRPPRGTAALFSCKSGERAFETPKLGKGHGVFFHHVIQGLKGEATNKRGEVTWSSLSDYVTDKVSDEVPKLIGGGAKQTPHEIKNLTGKSPVLIAQGKEAPVKEAGKEGTVKEPGKEAVVKGAGKEVVNSIGMKLVRIPAGKFLMGSTKEEQDEAIADYEKRFLMGKKASEDIIALFRRESPQHEVEITRPFYLGMHEVTQAQYEKVMGKHTSYSSAEGGGKDKVKGTNTENFPVEQVSWKDAVDFCEKLSDRAAEKLAGRVYRLPTEAEWEYSCRGGARSSTPFHFGNSLSALQANFNGNYPFGGADKGEYLERTCKVGNYKANPFGLHDMHGNVWEWCQDWFDKDYYAGSPRKDPTGPTTGKYRVLRGGSWFNNARNCRSAYRDAVVPGYRGRVYGFRVASVARVR
jgi:formylglycine-generating enzyme required for sulfatase activity